MTVPNELILNSIEAKRKSALFENLITEKELAEQFDVTIRYLQELRYKQNLPFVKVGHVIWYDIEVFREWLRSQMTTCGEKNVYSQKI